MDRLPCCVEHTAETIPVQAPTRHQQRRLTMFATYSKPQLGWLRPSALCAFLLSLVAGPLLGQTAFINETTPVEFSLQLKGTGTAPGDFFWSIPTQSSFGAINAEQVFGTNAAIDDNAPSAAHSASPPLLRICEIQGAGHTSPHKGEQVSARGIVTAVAGNGFYFQDPTGDGDERTSDGMFVYTKKTPGVSIGDEVQVTDTVIEYIPGGASTNNLSITEFSQPDRIQTLSTGNPIPAPVVIGAAGRQPPTRVIDNDNFAIFDPEEDGIDFYESLEGMLVEVQDAVAISPTNRFGEIVVLADAGAGQQLNSRGGLNLTPAYPASAAHPTRRQPTTRCHAGRPSRRCPRRCARPG